MSGHSKWHKIQHKKGKADAARGSMFTKLCKAITVAAQKGGGDPDMNFSLRLAIEKAKAGNVPKDNIDRAVRRGTGEDKDGLVLEETVYEGFGPGGVAFLVKTVSDNKNRTVSEVKHAFSKHGGSMGGVGSVQWQFDEKGVALFDTDKKAALADWEAFELALMDVGVEDIRVSAEGVEVIAPKEQFKPLIDLLEDRGIIPDDSGLKWVAKDPVSIDEETAGTVDTLYEALDDLDDVEEVFTNLP